MAVYEYAQPGLCRAWSETPEAKFSSVVAHLTLSLASYLNVFCSIMDIKRVVPVAIRAASCCIFSNSSFSYWAKLSQTTSSYSRICLIIAV